MPRWTLALLVLLFAFSVHAAEVSSVQSGSVQSTGNGTVPVTISSVDLSKSVLFFSTRLASNRPDGSAMRGRLANATTIEFIRETSESSTMDIEWFVVEFASGVSVQRGDLAQVNTTETVAISAVNTAQSMVLMSKNVGSGNVNFGPDDPTVVELISSTQLQFRVNQGNASHDIHWQVVEFTDSSASSQFGTDSLTLSSATSSIDNFSTVTGLSKALLLTTWRSGDDGADIDERMITANFDDQNTVRFRRGDTGFDDVDEIVYQVIEFNDDTTVQRGELSFSPGQTTRTVNLNEVDLNGAIALSTVQMYNGQSSGRTTEDDDDRIGEASFTFSFDDSTTLRVRRSQSSDSANVVWQVIEFPVAAGGTVGVCEPIYTDYALFAGGGISFDFGSSINGIGIAPGLTGANGALEVDGTISNPEVVIPSLDPTNFPANNSTTDTFFNINSSGEVFFDDVFTGIFSTLSITGGGIYHIDRLNVGFFSEVRLGAGTYYIDRLEMTDTIAVLTVTSGPVILHIGSRLNLFLGSVSLNFNGDPENLQIYLHNGATMDIGDNVDISATILGPASGNANIGDNFLFNGLMHIDGALDFDQNLTVSLSPSEQEAIAAIKDCVVQPDPVFDIDHDGNGINCLAEPITVTAKDADGNLLSDYVETITLDTQTGKGDWSLTSGAGTFSDSVANDGIATYQFAVGDAGVASFNLSYQEGDASVDVDVYQSNNSALRDDDTEGTLDFSPSGFTITNSALSNPPPIPINDPVSNKIAGSNFDLHLTAFGQTADDPTCGVIEAYTGTQNLAFWLDYDDPASGTIAPTINGLAAAASEGTATTQPVVFSNGQASVSAKYKDVGSIRINAKDNNISGATNNFVSSPADIIVSSVTSSSGVANPGTATANGTAFVAAGESFVVEVEVRDAEGSRTPNFGNETAAEGLELSSSLVFPALGVNGHLNDGTMANSSAFAATATAGRFRNSTVQYREFGSIQLIASIADGNYLGAGNVTGTPSATVGRFIPGQFVRSSSAVSGACGTMTYMDQPALALSYSLSALALTGETLQNYDATLLSGNVAGVDVFAENANSGINLGARLSAASGTWVNGSFDVATSIASFSRGVTLDGPFDQLQLSLAVTDTIDGLTISSANQNPSTADDCTSAATCTSASLGSTTQVRYGRLEVQNNFGPETEPLELPLRTTYFDGSNFSTNTLDTCTTYINTSATLGNYQNGLPPVSVISPTTSQNLSSGVSPIGTGLLISAPGATNTGSVDLTYDATTWLEYDWQGTGAEDPMGTAIFGTYRGHDKVIYWREIY